VHVHDAYFVAPTWLVAGAGLIVLGLIVVVVIIAVVASQRRR
jgi:hypothetical protein